jgi:hypothetical protein
MDEVEMEKDQVDMYFEGSDPSDIKTLKEVLDDYLENTPISPRKFRNEEDLIFSQTKNGILYRGYINVMYWNAGKLLDRFNLGNCLYITHVLISPRKGNILDETLKEVLNNPKINSIYIESIMSDEVLESFLRKGWTQAGQDNSVYLKKTSGGRRKSYKKRKNHKKRKTYKKRTYK